MMTTPTTGVENEGTESAPVFARGVGIGFDHAIQSPEVEERVEPGGVAMGFLEWLRAFPGFRFLQRNRIEVENPLTDLPKKPDIHELASVGNYERLRLYLNEHPDQVNLQDSYGRTPIYDAKNYLIAEVLIESGALVDQEGGDGIGRSALHESILRNQLGLAWMLLKHEAKVDFQMKGDGYSALMIAAQNSMLEGVHLLLEYGADPDIRDREGRRAIDFVIDYQRPYSLGNGEVRQRRRIIRFLLECESQRRAAIRESDSAAWH